MYTPEETLILYTDNNAKCTKINRTFDDESTLDPVN